MKLGIIIALILILAGLLFLWIVFFRLPLEQEKQESTEETQYLLDEEFDLDEPDDNPEAASAVASTTAAQASADTAPGPATAATASKPAAPAANANEQDLKKN